MRTRRETNNNKGIKRARIAPTFSKSNPHDEGPNLKRLTGGSRPHSWMHKIQSGDGDSMNVLNCGHLFNDDSCKPSDPFNFLTDDVMILILGKVSATASSPADLINVLLLNKRFNILGLDREVLKKATGKSLWFRAKNWSESAHLFLDACAKVGNLEACHFLGMIHFYCLANHASGIELLKRAAQGSHAGALYSLAIIYFNGSGSLEGGLHSQCDPDTAASLCIKSANLGNLDAHREVAYCLQHGVGLPCSPIVARRLLLRANTLEHIKTKNISEPRHVPKHHRLHEDGLLLTNYGFYEKMGKEVHAANKFMIEWWWLACGGDKGEDGLYMCSNILCGRRETRPGGFRRCSRCGLMIYCSHACQEMHWMMEHGSSCIPQNVPLEFV